MTRRTQAAAGIALLAALLPRALRARRRIAFRGRTVVITGGSRGLGLEIARQLAAVGARLTLCARDEQELRRAKDDLLQRSPDADVTLEAHDVSNAEEAEALIRSTLERTGRIDVLVNSAGVMTVGPFEHMQISDYAEAMGVHFWAPLRTMLAAIPAMKQQGFGRIVNVSSIGGRIGVPHLSPYCASKFALTGTSESLRAELARYGIHVTTVCPGLMRTGSPFNAWFRGRHRQEFAWFAISDSLPLASIDAGRAAAQVVDACRHGDAELVITWPARLAVILHAIAPRIFAGTMNGANRLLPSALDGEQAHRYSGWQSLSSWAPSPLTRMTERAAARNNEVPAG